MTDFVHLSLHSEYSITDSIVFLEQIAPAIRKQGMSAVALTDRNNLMALVKFQSSCFAAGIKPIIGCELTHAGPVDSSSRLLVLAMNQVGYHNLIRLVADASRNPRHHRSLNDDMLEQHGEGLILIAGGVSSEIGQRLAARDEAAAIQRVEWFRRQFGDRFYVGLTRTGRVGENAYIETVVPLMERMGVPIVAINDVICIAEADFSLHDAKLCIQNHERMDELYSWKGRFSPSQHIRSSSAMAEQFKDLPDAIANTVEIAKRCNAEVKTGTYYQRAFPTSDDAANAKILTEKVEQALATFLTDPKSQIDEADYALYRDRIATELDVIIDMGFAAYFLIVQDIVGWAREAGIRVGPGRGSGAASLVAMLLGITGLDPLKHQLFFERLLNRDRRSMPDLDIDFCAARRGEVVRYVVEKFGQECVGLIATSATHAAKGILHGMARALDYSHSDVARIAKLIPTKPGTKLVEAMNDDEAIEQTARSLGCEEIFDGAKKLEGIVSTFGVHPAGLVIAPDRLEEFVPCHLDGESQLLVSQFDKDDVEQAGMVKFDLLNLKNLTVIDQTVHAVNSRRTAQIDPLDMNEIPLDDPETFRVIAAADTEGVFQLESTGMKGVVRLLKPDHFADIVALVALYRPGPLAAGVEKSYALRKFGKERIEFDHPMLEPVLKDNYGLMIYQEDVMSVARTLAGFSGGEADILREAMGKKRAEKLTQLKDRFIEGCRENHVADAVATSIYDKMLGFSEYAFPKAHATAYALVTYQTAYLKTHYPNEYLAAIVSVERDNPDRLQSLLYEAQRLGLTIEPPDINAPNADCSATDTGFRVGLQCCKGVGHGDVKAIAAARAEGEFTGLFDFCMRVDLRLVSKTALQNLIKIGAFDQLEPELQTPNAIRAALLDKLEATVLAGTSNQGDMFGGPEEDEVFVNYRPPDPLTNQELWAMEQQVMSVAISRASPFRYYREFASVCTHSLDEVQTLANRQQLVVAGVIKEPEVRDSSNRGEIANFKLQGRNGSVQVTMWPEQYAEFSRFVLPDEFVVIRGRMAYDKFRNELRLYADALFDVVEARVQWRASIALHFIDEQARSKLTSLNLDKLKGVFKQTKRKGGRPLEITVQKGRTRCHVELGEGYRKLPLNDDVLGELREIFGANVVHVEFQRKAG